MNEAPHPARDRAVAEGGRSRTQRASPGAAVTAQEIPQQARQDGADQARADRRRHAPVPGAPWLPRGYLPRRVLWSRLNRSTRHAVTMVVAPAGAGKTLGVAGWVQHSTVGQDAIWLHAEKSVAPRHLESTLARAKGGPG